MKRKLYILSGAGLSADSGLATFRSGNNATWSQTNLDRVCNYYTWRDNKEAVFDFYQGRRIEYATAMPNDGHKILAEWQQRWGADRVHLLTQNVDDLLERAGAKQVTHLHGEINKLHCVDCGHRWDALNEEYRSDVSCPECNNKTVKPAVVMFNEPAPEYNKLLAMRETIQPEDIFLVVGTTLQVVELTQCLPNIRIGNRYPFNWQVNPDPVCISSFNLIEFAAAGVGLKKLETKLQLLM